MKSYITKLKLAGSVLVTGLLLSSSVLSAPVHAQATGYFPAQFIAKQYTEALGRMPDQTSWQSMLNNFSSGRQVCNAATLASYGKTIYTSSEYNNLHYDNAAKLLTLYRGSLNREPDQDGFNAWLNMGLNQGMKWQDVVNMFYSGSEFNNLASQICAGATNGKTSYYWGATSAPVLPTSGTATNSANFAGTQAQLQTLLNAQASTGGTVALAQKAVVKLTSSLTVPKGVTLTTQGTPSVAQYGLMGRLVRSGSFNTSAVYVNGGGNLENVWVDGARNNPSNFLAARSNVRVFGGDGSVIANNKFSNTSGATNVLALGYFDGYPCSSMTISGNVITAYSSDNKIANAWTDGISATCEHSTITANQAVDTSDAAIVLYHSCPDVSQKPAPGVVNGPDQASTVSGNYILSAGNSMYVGLAADPLTSDPGYAQQTCGFRGSNIVNNTMWSSPNTHFAIGIAVGTRAWFGKLSSVDAGDGATIKNNTTGQSTANVQTGIAISGMYHATVQNNTMKWLHPGGIDSCPNVDTAASISAGTASAAPGTSFPAGTVDRSFDACIGS